MKAEVTAKAIATCANDNSCLQAEFDRADKLAAAYDVALTLSHYPQLSKEKADTLAQAVLDLAPGVSNASALYELLTGKTATGDEANRYFAAIGLVPVLGGIIKKGGQAVHVFAEADKAVDVAKVGGKVEVGGSKATTAPRTPLAGPTENWKTFINAEKQIQLEAGARQRVDQVINETLSGKKNFTSAMTLTADEALSAGQKYLGPGYREIGKPGSGVFHSADGTREFRIDLGSISGAHAPSIPHVHFGVKDPVTGKYASNNHVPYTD
jgi:hypothetical protein